MTALSFECSCCITREYAKWETQIGRNEFNKFVNNSSLLHCEWVALRFGCVKMQNMKYIRDQ